VKVIILGCGDMLLNLLRGALLADVDIVGVFRYECINASPIKIFFHDLFVSSPVKLLMKKHKLHDIRCGSVNSEAFKREVLRLNADVILVGSWKEKFKKETIDLPALATINAHPSLLPKYRGPNPYLQAIWHKEKTSGVTFHLMDENFDSGPVLAQAEVDILPGDTSLELKNKIVFKARLLCTELLNCLKVNAVEPYEQNEEEVSYFHNVDPIKMTLDFSAETADEIYAHVRAFHPFLPTYIEYGRHFYTVNPYRVTILPDIGTPTQVLRDNLKKNTLIICAKDGRAVKFDGLKRYKKFSWF